MNIKKHLEVLGRHAEDKVTGFKGVVESICFDLYGCVQAIVSPKAKDGRKPEGRIFDVSRLKIKGEPVMDRPLWDFTGRSDEFPHGPADKPSEMLR